MLVLEGGPFALQRAQLLFQGVLLLLQRQGLARPPRTHTSVVGFYPDAASVVSAIAQRARRPPSRGRPIAHLFLVLGLKLLLEAFHHRNLVLPHELY